MKVLNFYHLGKKIPEGATYIGRASRQHGLEQSVFANPFAMESEEDRQKVVDQYKRWLWNGIKSKAFSLSQFEQLKEKDLVCYCAPKACHGDVLKAVVDWSLEKKKKAMQDFLSFEEVNELLNDPFDEIQTIVASRKDIRFDEKQVKRVEEIKEKNKSKDEKSEGEKLFHFFFHLSSPFSNFHPSKFSSEGQAFIANEQFLMFRKAQVFGDIEVAQHILDVSKHALAQLFLNGEKTAAEIVSSPFLSKEWNRMMMEIKAWGRKVKGFNDQVWEVERLNVMGEGVTHKFEQNEDLKRLLLDTGDSALVEASPYDKIWGIGLSAEDAKKVKTNEWPGLNLLGHVLDQTKHNLRFENEKKKRMSGTLLKR